jgi:nitrous oxidase accessory protein NosD
MKIRMLLILTCIGSFISALPAAERIVVPDAVRTIQKAIDQAHDGDTVLVRNGTYHERLMLRENVALIGENWQKTVISGNGKDPVIQAADRALIKNLTIKNGGRGILCANTVPVIDHCIIANNKKSGIQCIIGLPEIKNSVICDNDWTGIYCESCNGYKTFIEHCVIARNRYSGIMLAGNSNVLVHSSIFFDNRQYAVFFGLSSQRSRVEYNDFYGNRKLTNRQGAFSATNVALDPRFAAEAIDNYDFASAAGADALRGAGKDNTAIGICEEQLLLETIADSASAVQGAPSAPADSLKK